MLNKFRLITFVIIGLLNSKNCLANNINPPVYSEKEKEINIQRLRELANKTQEETIKSSSNYNKAMFDAARMGYGGYSDINVEFDINDRGLSDAEKSSIQNTRRNAAIMKEQLKGLK